jgi:hypothetical protein
LNCSNTNISSLKGTAGLNQLVYLNCSKTNISDLELLNDLEHLKSVNCDDTEVRNLDLIKSLESKIEISYKNTPAQEDENSLEIVDLADRDSLFEEAARLLVQHQQGSTSLIQRKLKLGYNRAGRLIDQLEAAGIVGSFDGSNAREVLVKNESELEKLLNHLNGKYDNNAFYSELQQNSEEHTSVRSLELAYSESQELENDEPAEKRKKGFILNFIRYIFNI